MLTPLLCTTAASLLVGKLYMAVSMMAKLQDYSVSLLVAVVTGDLVFIALLVAMTLGIQRELRAKSTTALRKLFVHGLTAILVGLEIVAVALQIVTLANFHRTGSFIEWELLLDLNGQSGALDESNNDFYRSQLAPVFVLGGIHLAAFVLFAALEPRIQHSLSSKKTLRRAKVFVFGLMMFFVFRGLMVQWTVDSSSRTWSTLKRNIVYDVTVRLLSAQKFDVHQFVRTGDQFDSSTQPRRELPLGNANETDAFKFTARKPESAIKNLVFITLESMRADIFDVHADASKRYLTDEARQARLHAPFLSSLTNQSLFLPKAITTDTYTIKSMFASLCSMYPFPVGFTSENRRRLYNKCLPQILEENGWDTAHFQPSDLNFDDQNGVLKSMGFKESYGKENYKFESVNYFGFEDKLQLPSMIEWIDNRTVQNKPFMLSYLTNVMHDPYDTPKDFVVEPELTKSDAPDHVKAYYKAVRYVDETVEQFIQQLKERDLLKDTLVVIAADHGVALDDHGWTASSQGPYEYAFRIPMMFYTENTALKRHWGEYGATNLQRPFTTLDLVPTLMDYLSFQHSIPPLRFQKAQSLGFEGVSILAPPVPDRVVISIGNPFNWHCIIVRQNHLKLAFYTRSRVHTLFDLQVDPNEDVEIEKPNAQYDAWIDFALSEVEHFFGRMENLMPLLESENVE